jgi:branched-chain amino acid transport system permease protein
LLRRQALCYRTLHYRLIVDSTATSMAAAAGILMALWPRCVGPQTTVGFNVMLNILLMCVIGDRERSTAP